MKKSMDMIQFESRAEIGGRAGETDETALSRGKRILSRILETP